MSGAGSTAYNGVYVQMAGADGMRNGAPQLALMSKEDTFGEPDTSRLIFRRSNIFDDDLIQLLMLRRHNTQALLLPLRQPVLTSFLPFSLQGRGHQRSEVVAVSSILQHRLVFAGAADCCFCLILAHG